MADVRDQWGGLPEEWIAFIEEWQKKLPPEQRERAARLLERLPALPKPLRGLFNKVYDRARATFNENPVEIAVIGPVNSGKSTLLNALTGSQIAEVSPIPGTTRHTQRVMAGPFSIADTPGMGEAFGEERTQIALEAARKADLLLVLFDGSTGITESSRHIYDEIKTLNKPTIVALNKIDLVKADELRVTHAAEDTLETSVLPISCKTGYRLGDLMKALVTLDARVVNIMDDLLPEYQREIARQRVASAAALSAAVGWEPLPVADIIPLTAIQAMMVLEIGKLYGFKLTMERARELLAIFAGGIALREGYRQLSKLIPIAGSFVSAGYAAAGTAALGATAIAWFESGGNLKESDVRRVYNEALQKMRSRLSTRLFKKRDSDGMEATIEETLETLPVSGGETRRALGSGSALAETESHNAS